MSPQHETRESTAQARRAERVDIVCDVFERDWRNDQPRKIEDCLVDVDHRLRDELLDELTPAWTTSLAAHAAATSALRGGNNNARRVEDYDGGPFRTDRAAGTGRIRNAIDFAAVPG